MHIHESGRTLVERAGVLCIFALLTVGGTALYGKATTKVRLNNLLDEVRKRAVVSHKNSSHMTYGMFDKMQGGASPITIYGYGVGDNKTGVETDVVYGHSVAKVPVGAVNGGHALDRGVCAALLRTIVEADENVRTGAVIEVYDGKCKTRLRNCGSDDEEEHEPVPSVICIAVKS